MKTVRDSRKVWPYCEVCGCRLDFDDFSNTEFKFYHFFSWNLQDTDCRDHPCANLYKTWIIPKRKLIGVIA